jgi:hypothetical protein
MMEERGQQAPEQAPPYTEDEWTEQLYEQYAEDPLKVMAYLGQQAALATYQQMMAANQAQQAPQQESNYELTAFTADRMMAEEYPDWDDVKPDIVRALESDPGIMREEDASSLKGIRASLSRAYQIAKYNRLQQQEEQLAQAGLTQAQVDEAMKLQAQTLSGASARPNEPSPNEQKLAQLKQAIKGSSYSAIRSGMEQ